MISTEPVIFPIPTPIESQPTHLLLKRVLTPKQCEAVLELARTQGFASAHRKKYPRRVFISPLELAENTEWLYERVARIFAKNNVWKFALSGISEALRVQSYRKGCFTRMHADYDLRRSDQSKMTLVIPLVPSSDYEGGDSLIEEDVKITHIARGDALLFPSFLIHGVNRVRKGERIVLTAWATGPRLA